MILATGPTDNRPLRDVMRTEPVDVLFEIASSPATPIATYYEGNLVWSWKGQLVKVWNGEVVGSVADLAPAASVAEALAA